MDIRYWDNVEAFGDGSCGCWLQIERDDVAKLEQVRGLTQEEGQAWLSLIDAAPEMLRLIKLLLWDGFPNCDVEEARWERLLNDVVRKAEDQLKEEK